MHDESPKRASGRRIVADARRRTEDPSIATDADALQQRFAELAQAQAEVDRLYRRWSELEAKS